MASPPTSIAAIVGAAQVIQRPVPGGELNGARGPIELMVAAAQDAATDAGAPSLLSPRSSAAYRLATVWSIDSVRFRVGVTQGHMASGSVKSRPV